MSSVFLFSVKCYSHNHAFSSYELVFAAFGRAFWIEIGKIDYEWSKWLWIVWAANKTQRTKRKKGIENKSWYLFQPFYLRFLFCVACSLLFFFFIANLRDWFFMINHIDDNGYGVMVMIWLWVKYLPLVTRLFISKYVLKPHFFPTFFLFRLSFMYLFIKCIKWINSANTDSIFSLMKRKFFIYGMVD